MVAEVAKRIEEDDENDMTMESEGETGDDLTQNQRKRLQKI
jgi:hypothetical protein